MQVFGVPKSVGQIYGLLYASPTPLSFSDIVARLGISKGSASQGLRLLRSLGAVNVAGGSRKKAGGGSGAGPGDQRAGAAARGVRIVFEPELSLRKLVGGIMRERISPLAAVGDERLGRLRELARSDEESDEFCIERVRQLETWRRRLRAVLPVLAMLLGPKERKSRSKR